jgi:chromosome segregation ATPase
MANDRVKSQIDRLKETRKKIEDAIAKYDQTIEAMKGKEDPGSKNKRKMINGALEKLRAQKEQVSSEIEKLEGQHATSDDPDKLEKEIKELQDRLSQQNDVTDKKIGSIRERIDQLTEDNDLLEHLMAKERLKLKIRYYREVQKHITNKKDREEIAARLQEEDVKLKDWDEKFAAVIKEVDDKHGDDQEVKDAKEKAQGEMEKEKERIAEISKLHQELESAYSEPAKKGIQDRIDKLEKERLESDVESGKKTKEEAKESNEIKDLKKKIAELESAEKDLADSKEKGSADKLGAVQAILKNYRKKLEDAQKDTKKSDS